MIMNESTVLATVRVDRWLWAVRLFKTRQLATDACRFQRIRIAGVDVKAARLVRVGDVIEVALPDITRTVMVRALLEKRVGAKRVADFLEDRTAPAEYAAAARRSEERRLNHLSSPVLKPSKRDRRQLEAFLDEVRQSHATGQDDDEDD
jgi:ribosome-associated heat shock protein Hsp15